MHRSPFDGAFKAKMAGKGRPMAFYVFCNPTSPRPSRRYPILHRARGSGQPTRTACAALSKIEFEMYALSQITSYYADDRIEAEYMSRMRQHRKENNSGGDKLPPNVLAATCKREIGMR